MKYLLIIILSFITLTSLSQTKCPAGYKYVPRISTSGYRLIEGCYPDSIAERLMKELYKSACEETSVAIWSEDLRWSKRNTWNDSTGCSTKECWRALINNNWVEITKKQYDSICNKKAHRTTGELRGNRAFY